MRHRSPFVLGLILTAPLAAHAHAARPAAAPELREGVPHLDPIVATVLGDEIRESQVGVSDEDIIEAQIAPDDVTELRRQGLTLRVICPLQDQFVADHIAQPTQEEFRKASEFFRTKVVDALTGRTQHETRERLEALEAEAEEPQVNQQQRDERQGEIDALRDALERSRTAEKLLAGQVVLDWKFQSMLHRRYGGRACHGQTGPEAIDAMRAWLKEAAERGDFSFAHAADQAAFWSQFPAPGEPIPSEIKDAAQTFETFSAYLNAAGSRR